MLLGQSEALLIVRVVLGLYWAEHGLKMFLGLRTNHAQLEKTLSSLKPSNSVGVALLNGIRQHNDNFSVVIPLSMLISGLCLVLGIVPILASISLIVIPVSIIVMQPSAPGAVRNLSLLSVLGFVIAVSTSLVLFSPFSI